MGEKIIVGPGIDKGFRNDRPAFMIDNNSFPYLQNAFQWRGRIKRKRGTASLCRLQRFLGTTDGSGNFTVTITPPPVVQSNNLVGVMTITIGTDIFVDPGGANPTTLKTNSSGTGTINRATGVLTITGSKINTNVFYYPSIPVMGLETLQLDPTVFQGSLDFDTRYSYNIQTAFPYVSYDVSFFKNPAASGTLPGYVPKTPTFPSPSTALWWNGQDYQQFWSVNYENALWAINGITIPYNTTNIGMQFSPSGTISAVSTTATTVTMTITNCPLIIGDFVFLNEWQSTTPANATLLNFLSGYVTACNPNTPPLATKTVTITFPGAAIPNDTYTNGMVQYLTTRVDTTRDCIRFYDGDPTNGSTIAPALTGTQGWVNFCPPLSRSNFSIANVPLAQYYLVGARLIIAFKDRLLFFGPVIQNSGSVPSPIYLPDTVIYSENGTPYYTATFNADPTLATTVFNPILVPLNQTAVPGAFWGDQTGFGGFQTVGLNQSLVTVAPNQDALICGFEKVNTKLLYSGNDITPFNFFIINSELGSTSTFSSIILDEGVMTKGARGYVITSQNQTQRFDLEIPDEVFEMSLTSNGNERFTAQRDFINEWIYFTYPGNSTPWRFPNTTLFYNYREQTWAQFFETYTTYGEFKKQTGFTWATVGNVYPTWQAWNVPWNAGSSTLLNPDVIAGNQQGYVLVKDDGTQEAPSLNIQNIDNSSGTTITSPDHCLNLGDYIVISGVLGTASALNGNIYSVVAPTQNTFMINPSLPMGSVTYQGGGQITRMYIPFIQTKQFPVFWGGARKTRLGPQQYLFTSTPNGQITLLIYLSQNSDSPYNNSLIVPQFGSTNNSLIYSTILYTCAESTNLGLTPANINLQTPTARQQEQIWHRMNTSLIGDTVQIGFTLNDTQMRDTTFSNQFTEIELHGFILDCSPSQLLV